jgi:hypothetical protein
MELSSPSFAMAYRLTIYVLRTLVFLFANSGVIECKEYFIANLRVNMFWSHSPTFVRLGALDIPSLQLINFLIVCM